MKRRFDLEWMKEHQPLDDASGFIDRVLYARREQKDAMVLAYAASHGITSFNTFPRMLFTSPEFESGKTTAMDVAMMLCQSGWMADPTSYALRSKMSEPDRPTIGLDEISIVFGANGMRGRGSPLYKPLVEGYRKSAIFSMSVDRTATDVSSYCFVVMAGRNAAVPPDLRSRCIIIQMRPVPGRIELEDSLDDGVRSDGDRVREQMHSWVRMAAEQGDLLNLYAREARRLHPRLRSRKLQVWGALFAIARLAGGDWPKRCMNAFTALALDASEKPVLSAEDQVLFDAGQYLSEPLGRVEEKYLLSADLLAYLREQDEKLYTTKTDAQMARLMSAGLGRASVLTLPSRKTVRGWHVVAVQANYEALMAELEPDIEDEEADEFESFFDEDELPTTETTETTVRAADAA